MTILTVVQDAMLECGLDAPSSAVANTDTTVKQMVALSQRAGSELANQVDWRTD